MVRLKRPHQTAFEPKGADEDEKPFVLPRRRY